MVIGIILAVFAVLFVGALVSAANKKKSVQLGKPVREPRGGRSRAHRDSWWAGGATGAGSSCGSSGGDSGGHSGGTPVGTPAAVGRPVVAGRPAAAGADAGEAADTGQLSSGRGNRIRRRGSGGKRGCGSGPGSDARPCLSL